ncbi:amidohydrolase family protein [Polaromonas sp.]|uniref:N-acyl-D-amino-acid deacylase family protein n=1 Tax=Polaromonas sp. TaxID=1869339 RepID=UPI002487B978|nr:amidohydrolase family protein [Polaromonas sp.]MDI1274726.1 amidohydrolase family protein [Polaromonas sp.]
MLDLLIKGGTVVDGSGAAPFVADIGVQDGRIVEIGPITAAARETVDASGAWVTPGFVDIHTHYDGQATWDQTFSPSIHHGVTTVVMGNCGVGFAPLRPGSEDRLIKLMEGVEDIPGVALTEGVKFSWESFGDYLNALDAMPHSLDFLAMVPHDPLRMLVMGERAEAREAASAQDIAAMREHLRTALAAGAVGFSTGRSDNHRTAEGHDTPASIASAAELTGIARAFDGLGHGVVQVVSDFDLMQGPQNFDAEFDLVEQLAAASGRPLSMSWLQRDPGGEQYLAMQARVEAAVARGLPLFLQTAARGIGVINGLDASFHPFMGFPGYKEIATLSVADRAASMRDPARKVRILSEKSERLAGDGTPIPPLVDMLLARIEMIAGRMFPLDATLNYEPGVMQSFLVRAKQRGVTALEALYDYFSEGDGSHLVYFPIFNYNQGSLDTVRQMLSHPRALFGLGDAGAHVGTVCDASFSTFMLTHWVQGRATGRLSLEQAVEMMTSRNARYLGLNDRGRLAPGLRADINVIDPARLSVGLPQLVRDLPAGGKRFLQKAQGYIGTWVAGQCVAREGEVTAARPGRLVRSGQQAA